MYMGMLSGGLAGMSRQWWDESGGYDDKMLGWGGEKHRPRCAHVGVWRRDRRRSEFPGGTHVENRLREDQRPIQACW